MFFCPTCANLLLVDSAGDHGFHLTCQTCTFVRSFEHKIQKRQTFTLKRVDEIRGGDSDWEAVPKTYVICENCGHNEAYFKTRQMRSMDEPETIVYRCCSCEQVWVVDR